MATVTGRGSGMDPNRDLLVSDRVITPSLLRELNTSHAHTCLNSRVAAIAAQVAARPAHLGKRDSGANAAVQGASYGTRTSGPCG